MTDMTDHECEDCGLDLAGVVAKTPEIELHCTHDGNLSLSLGPEEDDIMVHPGDAIEVRWRIRYPEGGPPTITKVGWEDGHWRVPQDDRTGADAGDSTDAGAQSDTSSFGAYADEGTGTGVTPDGFEKLTGYRAWVIEDGNLRSVAHTQHVWNTHGVEEAICHREHGTHHVSYDLFRLRQEAKGVADPIKRSVIQSNIDREIMSARRSPERNCHCGIYALYDPSDIAGRVITHDNLVYGRIEAWGKVADYEKGFRAEKAEIVALYRPRNWLMRRAVKKVAKRYNVPVEDPPIKFLESTEGLVSGYGRAIFWGGFAAAAAVGIYAAGVVGYVAAVMTYSMAALMASWLYDKYRN